MLHKRMIGPIFRIIHSMYESVKSVVLCATEVSEIINQCVGVRQGCVLSPCLFSLFISDLPEFLREQGGQGVRIDKGYITCLLFADDGAIIANSKDDLQRMLNALNMYCSKWRMIVNVNKTEVVVFNRRKPIKEYVLFYEGKKLAVKAEFKYLGLMFHESRRNGGMIEHRLRQARKLIAAWKRRCKIWLFKPKEIVNQFMTCVLPALEYGSCLWGAGQRRGESKLWKEFETFWRQIAKSILDVPVRAPTDGVLGELGWMPFWVRSRWLAVKYWTRVIELKDPSIMKEALHKQLELVECGRECWLSGIKKTLCMTSIGKDYWKKWTLGVREGRDLKCITYTVSIKEDTGKIQIIGKRWEDEIHEALNSVFVDTWYADINRNESKNGKYGNKLRTYCKFKKEWGRETYLGVINNKLKRNILTRLRIGISPLRIESGRYEGGKRLPPEERLCKCCTLGKVEDEVHMFSECTLYNEDRHWFRLVLSNNLSSLAMLEGEKFFVECMKATDTPVIEAVADFVFWLFGDVKNIYVSN